MGGSTVFGLIVGAALLAVTIGLLAASWIPCSVHEYCIRFSHVTWKMDTEEVYSSKRVYVGPGGSFLTLPRKLVLVEATATSPSGPLDVWSADGQNLFLEISFYYGLRPDKVLDTYLKFGGQHDDVIRKIAAQTVRDCATDFETIDFFTKRTEIDNFMSQKISERLYTETFVNVTLFNLLAIDVPDKFEAAVVNTLITAQDVNTLAVLRTSAVYKTDMAVVAAEATANITLINARAEASGIQIVKQTEADLFAELQGTRADALALLATDLGLTSPDDLLRYLYTDIIRGKAANSTVAFGVDKVQVLTK